MSLGPNIKFCGGWTDNPDCGASIDVFETHFACLDVAGRHRWELARSLCSLSKAITFLPSYVALLLTCLCSKPLLDAIFQALVTLLKMCPPSSQPLSSTIPKHNLGCAFSALCWRTMCAILFSGRL